MKTKAGKWLKKDGSLSDTAVQLTLADFTHTPGTKDYTLKFENILIGEYTVTETTKDLTGKDVTVTYTVTKEGGAAGEEQTGKEAAAGVEKGKTTTVAFEDDYKNLPANTLVITKSVKGGVTQQEAEGALTFTIHNDTTGEYLLADGQTITDKSKAVLTLSDLKKADGYVVTGDAENGFLFTVTFNDVDAGAYTVTEENATIDGFKLIKSIKEETETIMEGGSAKIELEDEYEEIKTTGDLKITKTVKGGVTEEEAKGALTFTIFNETTGEYLLADGTTTKDAKAAEQTLGDLSKATGFKKTGDAENGFLFEVTFKDVAAGNYIVTEMNAAIDGYTIKSASEMGSKTLAGGGEALIELKDEYTKEETEKTGDLTFTKTVKGGVTQEEAEGALTFKIYNETTKEYLLADGKTTTDETKAELTLKDLSKAKGYKVTGSTEKGFLFEVTFEDVAAGTYTIIETNAAIKGFTIKSASEKASKTVQGNDDKVTIELSDEYEKIETTGDLIITKTVKGGVTQEEAEGALTFTIYNEDLGEYLLADGTTTKDVAKAEQTLKDLSKADGYEVTGNAENGFLFTVTFEGVPAGNYVVTEKNAAIDGYTIKSASEMGSKTLQGGGEAKIDLVDEYTKEEITEDKANLKITKTVKGGVTKEEAEGALTFTIFNETTGEYLLADGKTTKDAKVAEQTLKQLSAAKGYKVTGDAENGFLFEVSFEGVDAGVYTVTETNAELNGFKIVSSAEASSKLVNGGASETINLEDVYEKIETTGNLKITKTVKGGVTEEEAEGALTFTIFNETTGEYLLADGKTTKDEKAAAQTLKDLSANKSYKVTGTAENGFLFEVTFENVAAGTYTVTETNAAIGGYVIKSASEMGSKTLAGDGSETIELVDEYEKNENVGNLVITKSVKGGVTEEEAEGALKFTIFNETTKEYLLANGSTTTDEAKAVQTLKQLSTAKGFEVTGNAENGFLFKVTFEGVAAGTYTVTETNAAIDGYVLTSSMEKGEGTLATGGVETIELKDEYKKNKETTDLTIRKTVTGGVTQEEAEGALKFTIYNETTKEYLLADKTTTTDKAKAEQTLKELSKADGYKVTGDAKNGFLFEVTFKDVTPGTYTVTETNSTIEGFELVSAAKEETLEAPAKGGAVFALKDEYEEEGGPTVIKVKKTDLGNGDELEGAKIVIKDSKGNVVEEWTSGEDGKDENGKIKDHEIIGKLKTGEEYTLEETTAPDGYLLTEKTTFTIDETGKVTTTGRTAADEEGNTILLVEDKPTIVTVSKTATGAGEELEGALIEIRDSEGNVVESWKSGDDGKDDAGKIKAHEIRGILKPGVEYTLVETTAPDGYLPISTEITFVLDEEGKATVTGTKAAEDENGNTIIMVEDAPTVVKVKKTDLGNGEELEGAKIVIKDSKGEIVESWTSGEDGVDEKTGKIKDHEIIGKLKTGEKYTLEETTAPDGYLLTEKTTFTIDETGKVTTTGRTAADEGGNTILLVEDKPTVIKVKKTDLGNGEELEGAVIQILDKDHNVVDEWISGEDGIDEKTGKIKDHEIIGKLKTGEEYTLVETTAPAGYKVAEKTTFTIDETGKVTTAGKIANDEEGNTILLIEDDTTKIKIKKNLKFETDDLFTSKNAEFYVGLFEDEEGMNMVGDKPQKVIFDKNTCQSSEVVYERLDSAKTYYAFETDSHGTPIREVTEYKDGLFMVQFWEGNNADPVSDGFGAAVTIDPKTGEASVEFDNEFIKIPSGFYREYELKITKKVKGSNGKAKKVNDKFYIGVYSDEDCTNLYQEAGTNGIVTLELKDIDHATSTIKLGHDPNGLTLYFAELEKNGSKYTKVSDDFEYKATIKNSEVTFSPDNDRAEVIVTNKEKSSGGSNGGDSDRSGSVRTGDDCSNPAET